MNKDKQIIIDGIDVSGCCQYMPRYMEDYDVDTLDYCGYHFKPCKDVDVKYCYYKQLKRAEQRIVELNKTIKAKEQECERLKHDNGYEVGALEKTIDNLKAELKDMTIRKTNYLNESLGYKQKLEKIKKYLCENVCLEGENCKFCDNHDCINIDILKIIEE